MIEFITGFFADIMQFVTDIGQYEFLQKALITSIMVGIICGIIGSFIIMRGMALMGDAISHAVLPGVAISYMLGVNYFYGAVLFGVITAISIGVVNQNSRIKNDSAIGIVFTAFFALGVILISKAQTATDLTQILFGNVLSVRTSDMMMTSIVGIIILLVVILFYKELLVSTFDETMAAAYGLPTKWIHYGIMVLLTMATVASLQTVGVVLVVAMLITPAATAYLLTNRYWMMIILAAFFGSISSIIGLFISFNHNLSSGAVIVLAATTIFILAFIFSPKQGILWQAMRSQKSKATA